MIVKIARAGTSFRGAGKYYLHDKRQNGEAARVTSARVGQVEGLNLANDAAADPEACLSEMAQTAFDQYILQLESGQNVGRFRQMQKPVHHISISWKPEEQVTTAQQMKAARDYLAHMGWDGHQALIVQHTDTEHDHVHIILNGVHPDTGLRLDDHLSKKRSRAFEKSYAQEHGFIYMATPDGQGKAQDKTRLLHDDDHAPAQGTQKDGLYHAVRHAVFPDVREDFKPKWRGFYDAAHERREKIEALSGDRAARFDHLIIDHLVRGNGLDAASDVLKSEKQLWRDYWPDLKEQRRGIREAQKEAIYTRTGEALEAIREGRFEAFVDRLESAGQEVGALRDLQARSFEGEEFEPLPLDPFGEELGRRTDHQGLNDHQNDHQAGQGGDTTDSDPAPAGKAGKDSSDLAAGGIGAAAEAVADALGSMITPPSKADQARAKRQAARQEEERPAREQAARRAFYERIIAQDARRRGLEEIERREGETFEAWQARRKRQDRDFDRD